MCKHNVTKYTCNHASWTGIDFCDGQAAAVTDKSLSEANPDMRAEFRRDMVCNQANNEIDGEEVGRPCPRCQPLPPTPPAPPPAVPSLEKATTTATQGNSASRRRSAPAGSAKARSSQGAPTDAPRQNSTGTKNSILKGPPIDPLARVRTSSLNSPEQSRPSSPGLNVYSMDACRDAFFMFVIILAFIWVAIPR